MLSDSIHYIMGNCELSAEKSTQDDYIQDDSLLPLSRINIKTSTWSRDSHDLFDYESMDLHRHTFEITQQRFSLVRHKDHLVEKVNQSTLVMEAAPFVYCNVTYGGFFTIFS